MSLLNLCLINIISLFIFLIHTNIFIAIFIDFSLSSLLQTLIKASNIVFAYVKLSCSILAGRLDITVNLIVNSSCSLFFFLHVKWVKLETHAYDVILIIHSLFILHSVKINEIATVLLFLKDISLMAPCCLSQLHKPTVHVVMSWTVELWTLGD